MILGMTSWYLLKNLFQAGRQLLFKSGPVKPRQSRTIIFSDLIWNAETHFSLPSLLPDFKLSPENFLNFHQLVVSCNRYTWSVPRGDSRPSPSKVIHCLLQAPVTSFDLGHLKPDCPLIPPDEDEICGDNPDPPEVIDMEMIEWKGKVVTLTIIEWQKSRHLSRHLQQQQQQQQQQRYLLQSVVSHQSYFIFISIHLNLVWAKNWRAPRCKEKRNVS